MKKNIFFKYYLLCQIIFVYLLRQIIYKLKILGVVNMKTMSEKNEKILKIIHLVAMSIWFSSLFSMFAIGLTIPNLKSADSFYYAHYINSIIDFRILTPAAIVTFLTGVIYGIFTKWKVKENKWLKIKVVITILLILLGTFWLGPTLSDMTILAEKEGISLLNNDSYLTKLNITTWFSAINAIILFFAIAISTFKPGNSVK